MPTPVLADTFYISVGIIGAILVIFLIFWVLKKGV